MNFRVLLLLRIQYIQFLYICFPLAAPIGEERVTTLNFIEVAPSKGTLTGCAFVAHGCAFYTHIDVHM